MQPLCGSQSRALGRLQGHSGSSSLGDRQATASNDVLQTSSPVAMRSEDLSGEYSLNELLLYQHSWKEGSNVENYASHNALPPVNRLPVEILANVFELVVLMQCQELLHPTLQFKWWSTFPALGTARDTLLPPQYWSPVEYWIDLILVCRYWRDVGLSTSGLWARIHLNERVRTDKSILVKTNLASASLERSGTRPLTLYVSSNSDAVTFPVPENHLQRVRELFLHNMFSSESVHSWVTACPALSTLVVFRELLPTSRTFIKHKSPFKLPMLKTLLSYRCPFWRFGTFGNLRHLIVQGESFPLASGTVDLFEVLLHNPRLEDLVLMDVTTSELTLPRGLQEYSRDVIPIVHLPSLKRMKIVDSEFPILTWLLDRNLVYPAAIARDFTYVRPASRLPIVLANNWRPNVPHPVKRLHVSDDSIFATDGTSATHLSVAGTAQREFFCAAFIPLFQSQTEELWFSLPADAHAVDVTAWQDKLQLLRNVKTLVLYGGAVETWLGPLSLPDRFFPSLTTLQIHHPDPECLPQYLSTFIARQQNGRSIETVRFIGASETWKDGEARALFESSGTSVVCMDETPLTFELPAVCTTDSPVHAYWPAWKL